MQAWYHCGNVYPFVPQDVLDLLCDAKRLETIAYLGR
jgi:hypothetical protein